MRSIRLKRTWKDKQYFLLSGCQVYTRRYMRNGIIDIQTGIEILSIPRNLITVIFYYQISLQTLENTRFIAGELSLIVSLVLYRPISVYEL